MEDPITNKLQLIRKSTFENGKIVNVLLTEFEHENESYLHYILIDRYSFFKKRYINQSTGSVSFTNARYCDICFDHFVSDKMYENHKEMCIKNQSHVKVFPNPDDSLYFKDHQYSYKRIFTGYADFESILEKSSNNMQCPDCNSLNISNGECEHSFTLNLNDHRAISVAFVVIDRYGNLVHEFVYSGDDVVIKFIRNVLHCEEILVNTTKFNRYMEFSKTDKEHHEKSTVCYICNNNKNLMVNHENLHRQCSKSQIP